MMTICTTILSQFRVKMSHVITDKIRYTFCNSDKENRKQIVQVKIEKMKIIIKKIKDIKQQDGMSLIIWRFSCVVSTCLERTGLVNSLVPYLQNVTHLLF